MENNNYKKGLILGIIVLFIGASVVQGINYESKLIKLKSLNDDWWKPEWEYRKPIVIDHTNVQGTIENFPVLIHNISSDFIIHAQSDGDDFVFTTEDNDKLYHEIEYYNTNTGELHTWVNIPILSSSTDTILYIYYGNPITNNQEEPSLVWNSNFKAVWHMSEYGTWTRNDSTQNNHHGTPYNYNGDEGIPNGKVDGADNFDGKNDYIRTFSTFDYNYRTVSFWFKTDTLPISGKRIIVTQNSYELINGSFYASVQPNGLFLNAANDNTSPPYSISQNKWYHCHLIRNGSNCEYYVNATLYHTSTANSGGPVTNPNKHTVIASARTMDFRFFDGTIDEIRISDIARSSDWIAVEYTNQKHPNSFISVGPEQTPIPDLTCIGELSWEMVEPGSIVEGEINVLNVGDQYSKLDWEVLKWPNWSHWTFAPPYGFDLTPEDGETTIKVFGTTPDEENEEFEGVIMIVNSEDISDYCIITVNLETPKKKTFNINLPFQRILEQHPNRFPMLEQLLG